MDQNFETCKEALCCMKEHGHSSITVSKIIPERLKQPILQEQKGLEEADEEHEGLQGADKVLLPKIRLYEGKHIMGPTEIRCLILKLDKFDEDKHCSFQLLKNFRNPSVVTLQAFCEDACLPRIALSWVDARLDDIVRSNQGPSMFFKDSDKGKSRSLTEKGRHFIINICTGLDSLFKEGLYPRGLKLDDLYVCNAANAGSPQECVKMLILSVDEIKDEDASRVRKVQLWKGVINLAEQIKRITDHTTARSISRKSGVKIAAVKIPSWSEVSASFIRYIGHDVGMLKNYPDSWSYRQKGQYLLSIIAADESQICERLKCKGQRLKPKDFLKWPDDPETNKLPKLLHLLIVNDNKRTRPYGYKTTVPYHYLVLCRTAYKHFDSLRVQVSALKDQCQEPDDFLKKMERWEPEIWCILYDVIGVPDQP